MSDLRLTAVCQDCGEWYSGSGGLDWTGEHCDVHPEHRVIVTRSGKVKREWPTTAPPNLSTTEGES